MSLNIKNTEAHRLARDLARRIGESMTQAVTEARRERLARLSLARKPDAMANEPLVIGRRCARNLERQPEHHGALLYEEYGLPK